MEISVFGKLPSQADFFRHGNSGAAAREAETWFLDGYQLLRSENLDFPRTAVNVILTRPDWSEVQPGEPLLLLAPLEPHGAVGPEQQSRLDVGLFGLKSDPNVVGLVQGLADL